MRCSKCYGMLFVLRDEKRRSYIIKWSVYVKCVYTMHGMYYKQCVYMVLSTMVALSLVDLKC